MCDPITIAGIALTGASTVANSIGASKAASARNDALAAERIRQQGYDREAAGVNQDAQDNYKTFDADKNAKASDLGQYFNDQNAANASADQQAVQDQTIPQSGSPLVVAENNKQKAKADAFATQQGNALGALRDFGDVLGQDSRETARDAGTIGQIGSFKTGSSNVLPLELDAAQSAGAGYNTLGDVLGLGGSLAINKGLSGTRATSTTLGNYLGYSPTSAATFPAAPKKSLYSLFGG